MSWTAIILFFIVLILIFVMYFYFYTKSMIDGVIQLKIKPGDKPYEIASTSLDVPESVRYYYSFWVFIENNIPADVENVILHRGKNFILVLKGRKLYLVADADAKMINGIYVPSAKRNDIIVINENFQFQKWVHLVVAVDGKAVDAYLDGKLIKSVANTKLFLGEPSDSIHIGNMNTHGKLTRFDHVPLSISPQQVNNIYMRGSGQANSGIDEYGVNLVLKYKNMVQSRFNVV